MFAGLQYARGTTDGDADAGTVRPPSNPQLCSRVYFPSRKSGVPPFHSIFALCCDIRSSPSIYFTPDRQQSAGRAGGAGFFKSLRLERAFRDVQGARYHPLTDGQQQKLAGRMALGLPIDG